MSTVHRLLEPGGDFVSSTAWIGDMGGVAASIIRCIGHVGNFLGLFPTVNVFTAKELKASIVNAGFEIEREFNPPSKGGASAFLVAKKK